MNLLRSIRNRIPVFSSAGERYHLWYYGNRIWTKTTWMGVPAEKSPLDMWNYQEIISELKPSLIVEFGSRFGGSALFFSFLLRQMGRPFRILSVDIDHSNVFEPARADRNIELLTLSSADQRVGTRISDLRVEYPGTVFAIVDSDHTKSHVLDEMLLLRSVLRPGDYLIVEDSNINGHPVWPSFGPGPYEALQEYFSRFPNDYAHDTQREKKFGFTFAPSGFLIRR